MLVKYVFPNPKTSTLDFGNIIGKQFTTIISIQKFVHFMV